LKRESAFLSQAIRARPSFKAIMRSFADIKFVLVVLSISFLFHSRPWHPFLSAFLAVVGPVCNGITSSVFSPALRTFLAKTKNSS